MNEETAVADDRERRIRAALEYTLGTRFQDGNRVDALQNGDEIFPAMLDAIASARKAINFLTYVYWTGSIATQFAEALAARARAGVRVRVVLDAFGCRPMRADLENLMREAGVEVRWFRPLATVRVWRNDKRTHRKLLIVDDAVGFTGGVGIAEQWEGDARNPSEWRDTHFRISGPAVAALTGAFLDNWNESGEWEFADVSSEPPAFSDGVPIQVTRASSTVGWTDIATLVRTLIGLAEERILITTPYFVPDAALSDVLQHARARGVEVRMIMPGQHADTRLSEYAGWPEIGPLLESGVEIRRYQPTFLHSKTMLVDGIAACIGSANLNHRSLAKDEECCAVILSRDLVASLTEDFEADWDRSKDLLHAEWSSRGLLQRAKETLVRLWVEQF